MIQNKKQSRKSIKRWVASTKEKKSDIDKVFEHYKALFREGRVCKLNEPRRKVIRNALKRHDIIYLFAAITNMKKDDWKGRAKYDDISYAISIIKGIDNVERWAYMQPESTPESRFEESFNNATRGK